MHTQREMHRGLNSIISLPLGLRALELKWISKKMVSPKKYNSMKRKISQYAIYLVVTVVLLSADSCKKEFLNVNNNENSPEIVDVKFALPSAESYIGYTV